MPVLVLCPGCGSKLQIPDKLEGKTIKCPKCQGAVPVRAAPSSATVAKKTAPAAPTPKSKVATPPELPKRPTKVEEKPVEPEPPPPVDPSRKRKKKRKKRPDESGDNWVWWAGGVGVAVVLVGLALMLVLRSGHRDQVITYCVGLAVMLPISMVILIASMVISSAIAGGINFGEVHTAIFKSLALLLAVNLVTLVPFGVVLAFPIWLLGLMYLFGLDLWEARFLVFVNWMLNFLVKAFILATLIALFMHGKIGRDALPGNDAAVAAADAADKIEELGGKCSPDINDEDSDDVVQVTLAGTRVTDAQLSLLKNFPKLRTLDLSRTAITDAGLARLKGLTKLQQVNLTGTQVTDAGVNELQKSLPRARIVR